MTLTVPLYVFFSVAAVLVIFYIMIWQLENIVHRLKKSQFDPERHICIDDVEAVLDDLYFSSESLPDDTTYRSAYRCGYQAAILAVERRLNDVCDSSTSNKH